MITMTSAYGGYAAGSRPNLSAQDQASFVQLGVATFDTDQYEPLGADIFKKTSDGQLYRRDAGGAYVAVSNPTQQFKMDRGTLGRKVASWNGALTNSAGTTSFVTGDLPPQADNETRVLKITQNATATFGRIAVLDAPFPLATIDDASIGIWVKNPNTRPLDFYIHSMATGAPVNTYKAAVEPGEWKFLTLSSTQLYINTMVYGTNSIEFVKIEQNDTGGNGAWVAGEYLLFSSVYAKPKGRPRFMIGFDDGYKATVNPVAAVSTMPASGRSLKQICDYYGFKATLYMTSGLLNKPGYITTSELLALQDAGWSIGSHSATHPAYSSRGLTSLGPIGYADVNDTYNSIATNDDTAIYNDIMTCVNALGAVGVYRPERLFALPQGAWDMYVRSALIRSGIKHVRGVSNTTNTQTISVGLPSGGGAIVSNGLVYSGFIHQTGSPGSEAETIANMQTYIDKVIAQGATGSLYHHGLDAASAAKLDGVLAYLKTKSDAGLIDVVTGHEMCDILGL